MWQLEVGDIKVFRVVELEGPTQPGFIFADASPEVFQPHLDWLAPWSYDPATHMMHTSVHTYVLRAAGLTVLVDTCVGNDKPRPEPFWNQLTTPYLERLAAAGVIPEDVDVVLCTHLHTDHIGWNTRLRNGHWVPTFPRARYLFQEDELAHWEAKGNAATQQQLKDSVAPVIVAGQAERVRGAHEVGGGIVLEPTPGHTPGHYSVKFTSKSKGGVITGDMMHHPIQIAEPGLCSRYCVNPALAVETRIAFLERYADQDVKILGTHFAPPHWGRLKSGAKGFQLEIPRA